MKNTFESRYAALEYARQQPDWRVGNEYGIDPVVFDTSKNKFLYLRKSGGFFLEPWYSWQEEK